MSYAIIDDISKRYKPIRTVIGAEDLSVSSSEVASIYISDAESFVDSFISRRYVVPLNPVPPLITQVTSDLAIFNIMVEKLPEIPDFMQARYDRSLRTLEAIRDGLMDLASVDLVSAGDQEAWSSTEDWHPVFSPVLGQLDQAVDKDQVDSDKGDRVGDQGSDLGDPC